MKTSSVVVAAIAWAATAVIAAVSLTLAGRVAGLLPAGAIGALLVVASDLLARELFAPIALPVGVVTAFLGAPYLLFLLTRANRAG
ncbi:iron chelate uptake ABC transporter family permease subunit [Kribbella sp. NPDC023855]|uniref:iron chelate uptake ABC transporter family permease subunit n=1 Tax=Kribbella sp. NPDC023855 TaxID=3154698 RepID=UPI0033E9B3E4